MEYNKLPNLIKAMVKIHEEIKAEIEISAVSLRDVERFKTLYIWFSKYLFNADEVRTKNQRSMKKDDRTDKPDRVVILSLLFCYCMRFSQQDERLKYMNMIENTMGWQHGYMKKVITEEQ